MRITAIAQEVAKLSVKEGQFKAGPENQLDGKVLFLELQQLEQGGKEEKHFEQVNCGLWRKDAKYGVGYHANYCSCDMNIDVDVDIDIDNTGVEIDMDTDVDVDNDSGDQDQDQDQDQE